MKTAEGWYQLAKGWLQSLEDMDEEALTTFESNLLEDLRRHVPDMEEVGGGSSTYEDNETNA